MVSWTDGRRPIAGFTVIVFLLIAAERDPVCWRSPENVGIWTLRRPESFPGVPSTARKPVKRVAPTILLTANGTPGAAGRLSLVRRCDRSRTLMRHAGLALASPIGLLALAVMLPACRGGLVSAA